MSVCNWRYEYVVSQVTDVSFEYLFAVVGVPIEYRLEHPAYDRIRNIFQFASMYLRGKCKFRLGRLAGYTTCV